MNSNENEININEIQINFNEVEINFNYESQNNIRIKCKLNEPIKQVLLQFSSKNNIDFDKLNFLTNGKLIEKSDYNEPTRKFLADLNLRKLTILVYNKVESEQARLDQHKEIVVVFWFRGNPTSIKSSINNKMKDILYFKVYIYILKVLFHLIFYCSKNIYSFETFKNSFGIYS
jgi:hypothetical protein